LWRLCAFGLESERIPMICGHSILERFSDIRSHSFPETSTEFAILTIEKAMKFGILIEYPWRVRVRLGQLDDVVNVVVTIRC
jgi:hypothetical protein